MTKKILIVDDEEDICDIYQFYLKDYATKIAFNGQEALTLINSEPFDLIISDINMPVMSGLKLLEACRKSQNYIPFIMVSAFGDKDKIKEAWSLGAYTFIEKPTNKEALLGFVNKALQFIPVTGNLTQVEENQTRNLSINLPTSIWKKIEEEAKTKNQDIKKIIEQILLK